MKILIFVFVGIVFLLVCFDGEKKIVKVEKKVVWKMVEKVVLNWEMIVEIVGMLCVYVCGGFIWMVFCEIYVVDCVSFDFVMDCEVNMVFIIFDKDKIMVDGILSIINKFNDYQFMIGKVVMKSFDIFLVVEMIFEKFELVKKYDFLYIILEVDVLGVQFFNFFDFFVIVIF